VTTLEQAFWEQVESADGCWEWRGARQPNGYGRLCIGGKKLLAHRLSYELNIGPVPDGLLVLHTCDNKPCVRPDHLYAGTRQDNARDVFERASFNHPTDKLSFELADELRRVAREEGSSQDALARQFGVSRSQVGKVLQGIHWSACRPT